MADNENCVKKNVILFSNDYNEPEFKRVTTYADAIGKEKKLPIQTPQSPFFHEKKIQNRHPELDSGSSSFCLVPPR